MSVYNKPQFNSVWASSGEKASPGEDKIKQGWVVEIPPHQYENWISNRQDQMLAHINQYGIAEWDSSTEYQSNKSYAQGVTTGNIYRALTTNTGINPETDVNNNWTIAFERSGLSLLKSQNLADVPDKAAARTNLGIATTADYDARYLLKSSNFADVPNKASARSNLDTFSKQEVLDLLNSVNPAGRIAWFATSTNPIGWLVANGQAVSRTTYSRLFAAIGTSYGSGNGTTTFNLPDLRGEFIRGADLGRGVDPGRQQGTVQLATSIPLSTVALNPDGSAVLVTPQSSGLLPNGQAYMPLNTDTITTVPDLPYYGTTLTLQGRVSVQRYPVRPRNVAMLPCISV